MQCHSFKSIDRSIPLHTEIKLLVFCFVFLIYHELNTDIDKMTKGSSFKIAGHIIMKQIFKNCN